MDSRRNRSKQRPSIDSVFAMLQKDFKVRTRRSFTRSERFLSILSNDSLGIDCAGFIGKSFLIKMWTELHCTV
ncbi:hypothetical protein L596_022651 [Steinernema carpocapsae]|uniref:Uncharacterized protein n=1 Tax=Steinernema carpocapsae TaxID=34508 RepID=A0A4U5MNE9_STECR|nr:hypothetical protein L596_022651 [Steinernema carpocapsae]